MEEVEEAGAAKAVASSPQDTDASIPVSGEGQA